MKNNTYHIFLFVFICFGLNGQSRLIKSPALSPFEKIETNIGISKISIEYSRPSMRGRKIFGELVPFGKVWRTGANKNNKIRFQDPVFVNDTRLESGNYTLLTVPNKNTWSLYVVPYMDAYGVSDTFDLSNALASINVEAMQTSNSLETMSLSFTDISPNSANITLAWENTIVKLPFEIPTQEILTDRVSRIESTFSDDLSSAAWTYYDKEKDLPNALECLEKAIKLDLGNLSFDKWLENINKKERNAPWNYMMHGQILADLGRYDDAINSAEKSLEIAKVVNSSYYQELLSEKINEWSLNKK